jgi:hypothetical protein
MSLEHRIACLEQRSGGERRPAFIFKNIPTGEPDRLCYDDGSEEHWAGGEDYPPGVAVVGGIDPDIVLGRPRAFGHAATSDSGRRICIVELGSRAARLEKLIAER